MSGYQGHVVGPNGEHRATTTVTPAQMAEARAAETARINRAVEARLEQEAAARAEQARLAAEHGARELETYREAARGAILGSGGSAADFERLWPELRSARLKGQAETKLTAHDRLVEQTKAEMRASGRYSKL